MGEWRQKSGVGNIWALSAGEPGGKLFQLCFRLSPPSLTTAMVRSTRQITQRLSCTYPRCNQTFKSQHGRTQHINAKHSGLPTTSRPHESTPDGFQLDADASGFDNSTRASLIEDDGNANPRDDSQLNQTPPMRGTKTFHPYLSGMCSYEPQLI